MATPSTWAQDAITCDICNNAAHKFCNSCRVKLCGNCINKHVNTHGVLLHDIVPFTNRNVLVVSQHCEIHPSQRCEACCQQCDVLVCMKCVITSHKNHNIEEIPPDYHDNRKKILLETEELQKQLDLEKQQSDDRVSNVEDRIFKTTAKFEELERELEDPRKYWHQEVDNIFDKHQDLIRSMKDKAVKSLTEQKNAPDSMVQSMSETINENKEILKTKSVSKVVNYKSKLQEYKDKHEEIDVTIPSLKVDTDLGKVLSIEFGKHKATLTQTILFSQTNDNSVSSLTESFGKGRVIADIQTPLKDLDTVACVGSDEAWIAGGGVYILRFNVKGSVKEAVRLTVELSDMSVTQEGALIFTDFFNKMVMIVRFGKTETLMKAPRGWRPSGLCCTNSGDILVNMISDDFTYSHHKIVRYQGQTIKQEIENDSDGNPFYQGGNFKLYIAENRNGDICASDGNAKKVVVVDEKGKIRFRYKGYQGKREKFFCPEQIATNSISQIIVTDQNNDCLHILDKNGHFLQCVDDCGLQTPGGLSVDSKGRCWVGLYSGKLKVISWKM